MSGRPCDVEHLLRLEYWNDHGCSLAGRYGDDGEMSCGSCGVDFKRMPIAKLVDRVIVMRLDATVRRCKAAGIPVTVHSDWSPMKQEGK